LRAKKPWAHLPINEYKVNAVNFYWKKFSGKNHEAEKSMTPARSLFRQSFGEKRVFKLQRKENATKTLSI
jgi:hypothetical protein